MSKTNPYIISKISEEKELSDEELSYRHWANAHPRSKKIGQPQLEKALGVIREKYAKLRSEEDQNHPSILEAKRYTERRATIKRILAKRNSEIWDK